MQDVHERAPIAENAHGEGGPGGSMPFSGFDLPESNFWRLPNNWFDLAARFTSWAEQKVVEYILRHTWGYHEYGLAKLITMDEFMHGRKRRDGSRIDAGCGMAENSIKKGIQDAVSHGFVIVETDDSDKGRIKKFYAPRMRQLPADQGAHAARGPQGHILHPQGQALTPGPLPLTPEDRLVSPAPPRLIPGPSTPDPRTEQKTVERLLQQETVSKTSGRVVAFSTGLSKARERAAGHALPERTGVSRRAVSAQGRAPEERVDAGAQPIRPMRVTEQPAGHVPPPSAPPDPSLVGRLVAEGIAAGRARQLVAEMPAERVERQLAWIGRRSCRDRAATLVRAIVDDFAEPSSGTRTGVHAFDRAKFFRGTYAVCPRCGSRPCAADCPSRTE